MADLLEQAKIIYEGDIDFKGQILAETLSYILLTLTGILSFFAGFLTQNIYNTLYVGGAGTALTFLVVVPPWPVYNSHPLPWLPARNPTAVGGTRRLQGVDVGSISVDGKKVN